MFDNISVNVVINEVKSNIMPQSHATEHKEKQVDLDLWKILKKEFPRFLKFFFSKNT